MGLHYIKTNIVRFIVSYILLIILFIFISYNFFLNDFIKLEKNQNENNLKSFLVAIDKDIENLKNTTNDYSKWDDTYEFMENKNPKYIYENFREGSNTLEGLNLDAMIYIDLENNILFSEYNNKFLKSNKENFEKYLTKNFANSNIINGITNYNSNFLYFSKSEVLKSDYRGKVNGHIITIQLINNEFFHKDDSLFKEIIISKNHSMKNDLELNLTFLKNIKIDIDYNNSKYIINNIKFYDIKDDYIISIITKSTRDIVINGKKTIYIFNLLVSIIFLFIFFFMYKNQYLIENQNILLNKEVTRRTRQLEKAFKKLKDKNKELYDLANIDSLTKIRNRRSFFIESEILLEKAVKNNHEFLILMIDIDHFKVINDNFGHAVGDKVLIDFCEIVNSIIDEKAIFGRIGGEEFCITFYKKDIEEVNDISERIRIKCENTQILLENKTINFTVSMGLSCKENYTNIDKILQKSDELLYEAKKAGRNRLIRSNRY